MELRESKDEVRWGLLCLRHYASENCGPEVSRACYQLNPDTATKEQVDAIRKGWCDTRCGECLQLRDRLVEFGDSQVCEACLLEALELVRKGE